MNTETGYRKIEAALKRANYRRRTRTISMRDVAQVLREAGSNGLGYHSGGVVPKAYKYSADTAAVAAIRVNGVFAITFGSHDAHRSASQVRWFGPHSSKEGDLAAWFASQTLESLQQERDWIVLNRRDVVQIIRSQRQRYHAALHNIPVVTVTREHSLACGNCQTETDRIVEALGVTEITSRRLLTYLAHHEPHLLPYARRAVDFAAQEVAQ